MHTRFEELASKGYKNLNENDRVIMRYISGHREEVANMGIERLALLCNVSRSTVMRFAQKLGLSGYSELKTVLRWSSDGRAPVQSGTEDDLCGAFVNTIATLRKIDCTDICEALLGAHRVFTYGTGNLQKNACCEFKRMMLTLGILVNTIAGESEFRKTAPLMSENDVVLFISSHGSSQFLREAVDELKLRGVTIVSITFSGSNYLANNADHKLFLHPEAVSVGSQSPFKSNSVLFFALELLAVRIALYRNDASHGVIPIESSDVGAGL